MSKDLGVWIQAVLLSCIIILLIINIFLPLDLLLEILFIAILLVMSYNNYKVYKRKGFTILYLVAALLVLIGIFV